MAPVGQAPGIPEGSLKHWRLSLGRKGASALPPAAAVLYATTTSSTSRSCLPNAVLVGGAPGARAQAPWEAGGGGGGEIRSLLAQHKGTQLYKRSPKAAELPGSREITFPAT